ncbi:NAD(P)/FAD-dependent oxidoreductase [Geodermatophilus sabuli]|uniref:3-phenylpropionate/trans-cinnamate dioxygenase ferredoxin reductase subunit n=1 Tax=Geodermatophilus sabuli TaxID=1564158 RepID=A0A285EGI0_9ACTN|nr:FAD-dependent oxidoreductase [Geodermatophilus sabuli]MBB3084666.1 3-phenylpropionate/trans-cinnamate dioxygenase ferredoxin reductase subunit [Geodermatophilus sabuli]SNX97141.1 3-phenylpropionate/trans-cinnamate dioxygenase ferredoxin reductase subunit [Geodermatophilus sabuli]
MTGCVAVVGAGQAGLQLATTLRTLGYDGRIVLVGAEPGLPYQRPPLSKGFLAGTVPHEELELRDPSLLAEQRIELHAGRRVVGAVLDRAGGLLRLDDGSELAFDRLGLATGATARRLPVPGADLPGMLTLRSVADAEQLRAGLADAADIIVVGGGFVGLEVAATARAQGRRVTVVEAADRLLARVVAAPFSAHVRTWHEARGTTVLTGAAVAGLTGTDRVTGVTLGDGRTLPADLVVAGVGASPVTSLAEELGLDVERGIVTDVAGRTSHPRVVAVGDCTVQPHPHAPDRLLGIESVNNAVEQATAAAAVLLGHEPAPRGVPWFWSNQGDLRLQLVGISDGYDELVVRRGGSAGEGRLTVLYYRWGRLIAADVAGNPRDFTAIRSALAEGRTLDPILAQDTDVPLRTLLTEARGLPADAAARA